LRKGLVEDRKLYLKNKTWHIIYVGMLLPGSFLSQSKRGYTSLAVIKRFNHTFDASIQSLN
jgi:hypothetical protein